MVKKMFFIVNILCIFINKMPLEDVKMLLFEELIDGFYYAIAENLILI